MKTKRPKKQTTGKDELNLAEFPFALLSRRTSKNQKTIECVRYVKDQNGKLIKQRWIASGSDKYGLPTAIDNDTSLAVLKIVKDNNFKVRKVCFSVYHLLKIQGKDDSKREYIRIKQSLERLTGVTIYSNGAFWDEGSQSYIYGAKGFHLFNDFQLFERKTSFPRNKEQPSLPLSYVVIGETFFNSIKNGYLKNLDLDFYFSLQTPLAKRLYRYLDKKKYKKTQYEVGLFKLATLLPLNLKYSSIIKRELKKAHIELKKKGFLKDYRYESTDHGSGEKFKVIYTFPTPSVTKALPQKPSSSPVDLSLFPLFESINPLFLQGVCNEFSISKVFQCLDILQFQYAKSKRKIGSLEALLYSALTDPNFIPPRDYIPFEEKKEIERQKELKEAHKAQKQEEQEREAELRRKANIILDTLKEEELKELEEQAREVIKEDLLEMKTSPLFEQISKVLIKAQMVELIKTRLTSE